MNLSGLSTLSFRCDNGRILTRIQSLAARGTFGRNRNQNLAPIRQCRAPTGARAEVAIAADSDRDLVGHRVCPAHGHILTRSRPESGHDPAMPSTNGCLGGGGDCDRNHGRFVPRFSQNPTVILVGLHVGSDRGRSATVLRPKFGRNPAMSSTNGCLGVGAEWRGARAECFGEKSVIEQRRMRITRRIERFDLRRTRLRRRKSHRRQFVFDQLPAGLRLASTIISLASVAAHDTGK